MADNPLPIRSLLLFSALLTPQNYGSPSYSSQQPFQRSDYTQMWWIQPKWTAQKAQDPSQQRRVRWGQRAQGRGKCWGWTRGWEGCWTSQERPVGLFFYVFSFFFSIFFFFFSFLSFSFLPILLTLSILHTERPLLPRTRRLRHSKVLTAHFLGK